jgi:hypothetical protein
MCNPEESVEAESFPFLKVSGWSISPTTFFAKKVLRRLGLAMFLSIAGHSCNVIDMLRGEKVATWHTSIL